MDPEKLRALLAVLKDAGVSSFKQGDLEVSFGAVFAPVKSQSVTPKDRDQANLEAAIDEARRARGAKP